MSKPSDKTTGLTEKEVNERMDQGKTNSYEAKVSKTTQQIISDNVLTLFNFLNITIALLLAFVGAFSNMFFILIIIMNVTIGIIIEIRARNMVENLSIIAKEKVTVVRDGELQKIETSQIVLDDVLVLGAGEQIPSDALVVDGKVEVNEALLTGESDLIEKENGDEVLSGSFISSGKCRAKVHHVGKDNYAIKLAVAAKVHKPVKSELMGAIRKVAKFTSYVIIPMGIILFVEAFFVRGDDTRHAVISSTAALLGMLPKGLALLIILSLATAVIKLARKKILVQEMYSIETLAHIDVLCLDKTGTITEGKMQVDQVIPLNDYEPDWINKVAGSYLSSSEDNNITMQALRDYFEENKLYQAKDNISFSSERKWGSARFEEIGTIILGAPERLVDYDDLPSSIIQAQENGNRVLMLGRSELPIEGNELKDITPIAAIEIKDPIRKNANQTLDYLKEQGVDLKVISGDNPVTVSNIARQAGMENYERYVDLSEIKTEEGVREAVHQYAVFGRVSPQQKRTIVQELKDHGHTVAMTGDGVNDVLALREADCSIAMAEGDSATRQISNLVLLDSDFTSLPDVLFEGRRVINNLTKVASIFFIKTIYSFIVSIICAVTMLAFPFIPIQITLIDLVIEGYPSFFLSFESDKRKVTKSFLKTVLSQALPNALLVVLNLVAVYLLSDQQGWGQLETTTLMYYTLAAVSIFAVIKACLPFNPLRAFLAVTTTVGFYTAAFLFRSILEIGTLTEDTLLPFVCLVILSLVLRIIYERMFLKKENSAESKTSVQTF